MPTIANLVKLGKMKVNDFIYYVPDFRVCYTNSAHTGFESQRLITDFNTVWKIIKVTSQNGVLISVTHATNLNEVILKGLTGYLYGINALDEICKKLYSKNSIFASARSFRIDDFSYEDKPIIFNKKRVYFPSDADDNGKMLELCGSLYEKSICEYTENEHRFYSYDAGGEARIDEKGNSYRTPKTDSPIFVTSKSNGICPDYSSIYEYWIASQAVICGNKSLNHCIQYMDENGGEEAILFKSDNTELLSKKGIRPVVYLSPILQIDKTFGDGSSERNPWKIAEIA